MIYSSISTLAIWSQFYFFFNHNTFPTEVTISSRVWKKLVFQGVISKLNKITTVKLLLWVFRDLFLIHFTPTHRSSVHYSWFFKILIKYDLCMLFSYRGLFNINSSIWVSPHSTLSMNQRNLLWSQHQPVLFLRRRLILKIHFW